jgi:AraC-like DNA-binding protein
MRVVSPIDVRPVVSVAAYREVPANFTVGPRRFPHPALIFLAEGEFLYVIEDEKERRLVAGEVLFLRPEQQHRLRGVSEGRAIAGSLHFEPFAKRLWRSGTYRMDPSPRRVTPTGNDPDLRDLFRRAAIVFRGYGVYRKAILQGIAREIWLRLAEYWSGRGEMHLTKRMRRMIRYLRRRLAEPVGRQNLAERFHLTPEHVNYLFKTELGTTPTTFVTRERVQWAYNLIHEEGLSVKEVAGRVGFSDPFYFSRTFKRIMGITPSEVR